MAAKVTRTSRRSSECVEREIYMSDGEFDMWDGEDVDELLDGSDGDGFSEDEDCAAGSERSGRHEEGEDFGLAAGRELGRLGEDAAAAYLKAMGFEVVERNWRCPFGEADIIAIEDERTVCFVEVKTRRSVEAGIPEEAVTPEKRARYERIALCYLSDQDWTDGMAVRFDAIGLCVTDTNRALLRHHRGCFDGRI